MIKKVMDAARFAGRAFKQKYNEKGEELPDPTPIEVPLGFKKPPTLHEQIKMFIRSEEFRRQVESQGAESFEEANDFELGDEEFDEVPTIHEMQEEFLREANAAAEAHARRVQEAVEKRKKPRGDPPTTPPVDNPATPPVADPDAD